MMAKDGVLKVPRKVRAHRYMKCVEEINELTFLKIGTEISFHSMFSSFFENVHS